MNVLITGHTSSIGSVLYNHLEKKYNVVGASRSTGYDLSTYQGINNLLEVAKNSDHFINLANINSQTDLLYSVHSLWSETGKNGKIINFGTLATEVPYSLLKKIPVDMDMVARKLSLEKMHKELAYKQPFGLQPQSILIRFANYGKKLGNRDNEPFTSPEQMIRIIDFILESDTYISNIDFREL